MGFGISEAGDDRVKLVNNNAYDVKGLFGVHLFVEHAVKGISVVAPCLVVDIFRRVFKSQINKQQHYGNSQSRKQEIGHKILDYADGYPYSHAAEYHYLVFGGYPYPYSGADDYKQQYSHEEEHCHHRSAL